MVDSIKNTVNRVDPQQVRAKPAAVKSGATASAVAASSTGDVVNVKGSAVSQMASAPPIDMEAVSRIKDAISRGEYPVDLDRVSDALMDAYRDLKS